MTNHKHSAKNHPSAYVQKIIRRAEKNNSQQHHLVPRFYLNQWADERKNLRCTNVDTRYSSIRPLKATASKEHYYSINSPDVDPQLVPRQFAEVQIGDIENTAKGVIDALLECEPGVVSAPDSSGASPMAPEQGVRLAHFLALQCLRGERFRQAQRHGASSLVQLILNNMSDEEIVDRFNPSSDVARSDVIARLQSGDYVAFPQDSAIVVDALTIAWETCPHFFDRHWVIYSTPPVLVTCDEPVVIIGGPGLPRDERAGLQPAGVIVFPLSPTRMLALFRSDMTPIDGPFELDHVETAEINREILASAHQWAFEVPHRKVATRLVVPPAPAPTTLDGPLRVVGESAGKKVWRSHSKSRWVNIEHELPDWPVLRWWQ